MTAGCISALGTKCRGFWCSALNLIFPQVFFVIGASHVALAVKNLPANAEDIRDTGLIPWFRKIPLEEGMATHSSILSWRIPQTEEPGGLQSTRSCRVGHDSSDLAKHLNMFNMLL